MSAPRLPGTNGQAASKSATGNFTPHSALRGQKSPLSPQKNQRRREPNNASTSVKHAPPPDHAACFSRGGARRRVHQAAVGWRDHEDRVGPIYKQDDGSEQPTSLEGAEKGDHPEEPADDGEARLHHVAATVGQPPLDEERAIVELKSRGLLGDVDVDRGSREQGGECERERSRTFFLPPGTRRSAVGWR